jgi:hypothetical protein
VPGAPGVRPLRVISPAQAPAGAAPSSPAEAPGARARARGSRHGSPAAPRPSLAAAAAPLARLRSRAAAVAPAALPARRAGRGERGQAPAPGPLRAARGGGRGGGGRAGGVRGRDAAPPQLLQHRLRVDLPRRARTGPVSQCADVGPTAASQIIRPCLHLCKDGRCLQSCQRGLVDEKHSGCGLGQHQPRGVMRSACRLRED